MAKKRIDLTLILPVHNEESVIDRILSSCERVLTRAAISYEVICVENGSTDNSYGRLLTYARRHDTITVMQSHLGWGNAVRTGILKAKGTVVCFMVSDGQVPESSVVMLYNAYKNEKNPRVGLWKVWRKTRENPVRLINSRLFALLTILLFGFVVRDVNGTPKLAKRSTLTSIPLTAQNIAVDLELLLGIRKMDLRFRELPVFSTERIAGRSTTKWKTVWEMIVWMIRRRFTPHRNAQIIKTRVRGLSHSDE